MLNAKEARKITNKREPTVLKDHLLNISYQITHLANEGCNLYAHNISGLEVDWQMILKKELKKKGYKVKFAHYSGEEYLLIEW